MNEQREAGDGVILSQRESSGDVEKGEAEKTDEWDDKFDASLSEEGEGRRTFIEKFARKNGDFDDKRSQLLTDTKILECIHIKLTRTERGVGQEPFYHLKGRSF